jgi:hypothetical protein
MLQEWSRDYSRKLKALASQVFHTRFVLDLIMVLNSVAKLSIMKWVSLPSERQLGFPHQLLLFFKSCDQGHGDILCHFYTEFPFFGGC